MTRITLTALGLSGFLFSCASDYKLGGETETPAGDTAAPREVDDKDPDEPEDSGELEEETDDEEPDPDIPEETGEPEVDPDQPIAVCSVDPLVVRPITGSANWHGTESYDPNGLNITEYNWTFSSMPSGSSSSMPLGADIRSNFTPDLAGDYVGRLVVTNEDGVNSEPCETTLEAKPGQALWVEMFWESPGDDMDLHLLAPGGTFNNDLNDCYYMNCTPGSWTGGLDWGLSGFTGDDPSLDLDDISTTGPENINIEDPEDDIYTVIVHDYPGSSYTPGNMVTINIYLDGSMAWTDSRLISGEDTQTRFAEIDAAEGTVTPL